MIPLGGLGEIGMNLMVYEFAGKLLVVDCGITFPNCETPGVDVIIPDTTFLEENKDRIVGFVITHGHEDHIGAMPHVWPKLGGLVYGTPLTIGLVKRKFKEYRLDMGSLRIAKPRETVQLGPFSIQFIQVTHSIVDACTLAITTPLGTVVHTGDFKMDHTPVDGRPTDLFTLATLGEKGVLALLSDSTNVTRSGSTISEQTVRKTLDTILPRAKGLIILATFASNIQRIIQVLDAAKKMGRKVVLTGRSMINNVQVAKELGYLDIPKDTLVDIKAFGRYPRESLLVLSTGSQGEPNSSLSRIANGDHREIKIQDDDMVVFSSKFIPGNERTIWTLINRLFELGADVLHEKNTDGIHVSGHAPREDLRLMMALTQPKFFMPIHGEMNHLYRHRGLAWEMGIPRDNTLVASNGDVIALDGSSIAIVDSVPSGRVFVDGKGVGDVGDIVLRDRRNISENGFALVVLTLDKETNELLGEPELLTRGVVYEDQNEELLQKAREKIKEALILGPKGMDFREEDEADAHDLAIRALRRFFKRELGRRPMVLPLVMEM
ncbi:MAG: ribonuclease J [Magnetococcales bacterium]|nr:ribonuclease J [Magnetococcales bacterium]